MIVEFGFAVLTATLSSAFTLLAARVTLDRYTRRILQQRLEHAGEEIERRVRAGAVKAGQDLLPEVKKRLRESFEEAVASLGSSKTVEQAVQGMARSGARVLGEQIDTLLGRKRET